MAALKLCNADRQPLRKLQDFEWTELLLFCDRMHLTISLGRACSNNLPKSVQSRINQNLTSTMQSDSSESSRSIHKSLEPFVM